MSFIKKNFYLFFIILLTMLVFITGVYALKLKEKYNNEKDNTYTDAFISLVNHVNSVENYLAKALITKSASHAAETLTQIWSDSNLAMVYLSRLPLSSENVVNVSKYLNQVSDYSYTLSRKNISGENLNEEDLKNIKILYDHSIQLENTLNMLSDELYNGNVDWVEASSKEKVLAQAVDNVNVFSTIDENLNNYEGLIYDGAYSDHINKVDKTGLTGNEISDKNAEIKVKEFFREEDVKNVKLNAYLENADIPGYDFVVEFNDKEGKANIFISKKGGHVVLVSNDREVKEEKISETEACEIGKKFLESKGFVSMKETYFIKEGNTIIINYAYNDNGIIVYPDLIKVKLALDNGEILGLESSGYLNSHKIRPHFEPKITLEKAKENINENLNILSESMAIIPTEWKTEIFCYEFKGKVDDKEFLVYINADTGKEEDILVVLDTPNGNLTM